MTEQLVTYNTAKLAEKCGFDLLCANYFDEEDENNSYNLIHRGIEEDFESFITYERGSNWDYIEKGYLERLHSYISKNEFTDLRRPTQSFLYQWIRNLYEIEISLKSWKEDNKIVWYYSVQKFGQQSKYLFKVKPFLKHEHAFEQGLEDSLNLIKNL